MTYPLLRSTPMGLDDFHELLADAPEDERWELINGRVIRMMVGARWEHARIVSNLHIGLGNRLKANGSPCRVFSETFRVEIDDGSASLMPDIMVFCARLAPGATAVRTPTVLMEVLSKGTAGYDRGEKRLAYQRIPSLRHYALVERDGPAIEVFDRQGENTWGVRGLDGLAATLDLPALDVAIPFSEIYADLFA